MTLRRINQKAKRLSVETGIHTVSIRLNGTDIGRQIAVSPPEGERVVQSIYRSIDFRTLGSPGEKALPEDSPARSISVNYPERAGIFAGLSYVSWALFGAFLVFGFMLRRPLGVDF